MRVPVTPIKKGLRCQNQRSIRHRRGSRRCRSPWIQRSQEGEESVEGERVEEERLRGGRVAERHLRRLGWDGGHQRGRRCGRS